MRKDALLYRLVKSKYLRLLDKLYPAHYLPLMELLSRDNDAEIPWTLPEPEDIENALMAFAQGNTDQSTEGKFGWLVDPGVELENLIEG